MQVFSIRIYIILNLKFLRQFWYIYNTEPKISQAADGEAHQSK